MEQGGSAIKSALLTWQQAHDAGIAHCGGKGWNLARLHHFGFSIPAGGVLSSGTYQHLLETPTIASLIQQIRSIPDDRLAGPDTAQQLEIIRLAIVAEGLPAEVSQELKQFIEQQLLSNRSLAVRSSATLEDSETASFAGIHESYLNVNGLPTVERAVLDCFASLWTLRAITYRRKMRIDDRALGCAVVIMALVDAQAAGIAFSCDPATGREDITVINANFGLGESVVGGLIEPDEYHLSSYHLTLLRQKTGSKSKHTLASANNGTYLADSINAQQHQVLSKAQIIRLGRLVQRVFWALSQNEGRGVLHQDIEWAFDGHDFILLQARPVTALPKLTFDALRQQTEIWSNGNFRDAAPMVLCTLGTSVLSHHIDAILSTPFEHIGYYLPDGLSFVRLFQGRAYFNVSLIQWVYFDSTGYLPAATNRNIGGHQPEIEIDATAHGGIADRLMRECRTLRLMLEMNRHKKVAVSRMAKEAAITDTLIHSDLSVLSDDALVEKIHQCDHQLESYALPFAMLASLSGSVIPLSDLLNKRLPGKGAAIASALLASTGKITSANHGYRLRELTVLTESDSAAQSYFNAEPFSFSAWRSLPESSPFKKEFQRFIDEYGHRAVYEGDISNPRWREDPSYLLNVIKQGMGNPASPTQKTQQKEKAEQAWKTVKKHLPFYQLPIVKSLVRQAAEGAALREMAKSHWIRLLEPARMLLLEAGRRFEAHGLLRNGNDIFHCAYIDVISLLTGEWDGHGLKALIESRRTAKAAHERLSPPDLILGDQPQYSKPATKGSGKALTGMGVAAGCAEGIARLIHTPEQGIALIPGDVLVAPSTDPAWTSLFLHAAAIAVETGGILSHGAIVAREYGIPAVMNIPGLFSVINDGDRVVVDGDRGVVERRTTSR